MAHIKKILKKNHTYISKIMDCFSIRDYQQTKEKQQLYHNKTEKKVFKLSDKRKNKNKFRTYKYKR